jgi:hypothetical protein
MTSRFLSAALFGAFGVAAINAGAEARPAPVAADMVATPIRLSSVIFTAASGERILVCDQTCPTDTNPVSKTGQVSLIKRLSDVSGGQGRVTIFKRDSAAFSKFCDASGKLISPSTGPYQFSLGDQVFALNGIGDISCSMDAVSLSYASMSTPG